MRITVFCGSRLPKNTAIVEAVDEFGRLIGENHWTLVYGGSSGGLMGRVAENAITHQAQVFGIGTPEIPHEVWRQDLTRLEVAQNLSLRKQKMLELGDVIVILPGGIGSLDEFFEAITLKSLGLLSKSIYILNCEGFWDHLLLAMRHLETQGLVDSAVLDHFRVVSTPAELVDCIRQERRIG
jgi:uncharacterized protein (TIGR00730 family)